MIYRLARIIGIVALIFGLVWAAQGSGYFPYPASSFMINQSPWIWRGLLVAACGFGLIWFSMRKPR